MKYWITITAIVFCTLAHAQQNTIYNENIHSLQLLVDDDPLQPPILKLNGSQFLTIGFDEMSHEYHRYLYHIVHCEADWSESDQLFESDYLEGLNDQPIENYENSFNTTQLYTHYALTLPNEEVRLILSGNYKVLIYDEEEEEKPVIEVQFCLLDPKMSIGAKVSSNTDIDFNSQHQQLSYNISYGGINVVDPQREIHTVVMQNRRQDNKVVDLPPNIQKSNGIEFTFQRALIFPAGNEFHKIELLDVHRPGLNIDNIRWYEPYYHATIFPDEPIRNYVYDEDQNGNWIMRNEWQDGDDEITSEYIFFHFILESEQRMPGDVYVCGNWTNGPWDPNCKMTYNEIAHQYEASIYLKQGYYNYQYRQKTSDEAPGITRNTDGDFYETENEYTILVYHRPQGGRYDQLVGYSIIRTN